MKTSAVLTLAASVLPAVASGSLTALFKGEAPAERQLQASTDIDVPVLQFALNLEYLEANFYSYAAYGHGIPECTNTTGGMKANLSDAIQAYAEELAYDEYQHVKFLQTALGNATVACPAMDLGSSFSTAANVATNMTLSPPYSPYYSDSWFLLGAFIFEDVGVTAYNGAAPLLTSKTYLGAAAGILAVEAYHAGAVRSLLTTIENDLLTPYPLKVSAGVAAVSALRAKVGGGKDQGILPPDSYNATASGDKVPRTNVVPANDNAIAYARNTTEVLSIVYLGGSKMGGFFPMGLNGAIA